MAGLFKWRHPSVDSGPERSEPVDILARLLRSWGRHSFDIDTVDATTFGARCEAWARHLTVGAPAPDAADDIRPAGTRYADLLQEMHKHRKAESSYVTKRTKQLKDALWEIVSQLRQAVASDERSDRELRRHLRQLEAVLEKEDVTAIRRAASNTVRAVSKSIAERNERYSKTLANLDTRIQGLQENLKDEQTKGRTDALTRLFNRGALDDKLPQLIDAGRTTGQPVSVLMIDIDHFKRVNDTYGHAAGDIVLANLGDALVRAFPRKSDFLARYGGEEFCVVLVNTTEADSRRLAERFLNQLRALEIPVDDQVLRITASIGAAEVHVGETAKSALQRADQALYVAKREGRDRVVVAREIV